MGGRGVDTSASSRVHNPTDSAGSLNDQHFRLLAENALDVVILSLGDGLIDWVSPSIVSVLGWLPTHLVGTPVAALLHPEDLAHHRAELHTRAASGDNGGRMELRIATPDGSWRWMSCLGRPLRDDEGNVIGGIDAWRDITDEVSTREALLASERNLRRVAAELAQSEQRYRMLAETGNDIVLLMSPDRRIMWVSPSIEQALGWTPAQLVGHRLTEFMTDESVASSQDFRDRIYSGGDGDLGGHIFQMHTACGRLAWMSGTPHSVYDDAGALVAVTAGLHDVTALVQARDAFASREAEQRRQTDELRRQALCDPLTGLGNRTAVVQRIEHALAALQSRTSPFAVLFADLDSFKEINDTYGHMFGDQLLVEVSRRIAAICGKHDLVARYGGDEFIVVVDDLCCAAEAVALADRIQGVIARRVRLQSGRTVHATASIGIEYIDDPTALATAETILAKADAAMYEAKRSGHHRWRVNNASPIPADRFDSICGD